MLNYFYLYSIVWSIIIFLHSLGWSDICKPMDTRLSLFFISTILLSMFFGYVRKERFYFRKLEYLPRNAGKFTSVFVALIIFEFIYAKQIPLFAILSGSAGYTQTFSGIPTYHVFLVCFGKFYTQYLLYLFLSFPKHKEFIVQYFLVLLFGEILWFSRMGVMICLFMSACMIMSAYRKKIKTKHIVFVFISCILIIYLFGLVGNIRSGYNATNNNMISQFASINHKWPSWLPKEFIWGYSYCIAPIANLNYNISANFSTGDPIGMLSVFIPDFIAKRVLPEYSGITHLKSASTTMTVIAGYGNAYEYGGFLGMIIFYLWSMFGLYIVMRLFLKRQRFFIPGLATITSIIVFMIYTNTLWFSAVSFPLTFPILNSLVINYPKGYTIHSNLKRKLVK